jgi:hypothetical protein
MEPDEIRFFDPANFEAVEPLRRPDEVRLVLSI